MKKKFDPEEAKHFLREKEEKERNDQEEARKAILEKTISILQEEFQDSSIEVFLVGSIIQPFRFSIQSDVDIVLKNYQGDRFECWAKLEGKIGRKIEIILFETCHFQEFVLKDGFKVK